MRPPIVTLTSAEIEVADYVARERIRQAKLNKRVHLNNPDWDEATELELNIAGVRAEIAARNWLAPIFWNDLSDVGKADLGDDIDAKAVVKSHHRLLLINIPRKPINPNWAYLLVRGHEHPTWHIAGWVNGGVALLYPHWRGSPRPNRPCIIVPPIALGKPREIWDYVERKYPADKSGQGGSRE